MRRANLDVVTRAHVHKIELSGNRATGVQYARGTKMHRVRAEREVIVSAGAYASPQLLMLSGIGPADHLAEMGIPVAVDSPHVGQHLQEHPMVFMSWHAENCTTVDDAGPRDLAQWALNRSGKFSTNLIEAAVHWTSEPGLTAPDFQILFIPGFFWDGGYRKTGHPGVTTLVSYLAPESRGSVSLQSTDPTVHPRIFSNILGRQSEMDALVRAVELIRDITSRSPLRNIIKEEIQPSAAVDSRTALADWLRSIAEHTYHPTCTCRMGPPDEGVVDPQLRVYGVDNLRVADASIMPRITSGNTHAPAVMIGERCADFVLGKAPLAAPADPAVMGGVA
jgi:choline dehydrogenase